MSYLTRAIGAAQLLFKAHAPTIMVTTGVASMTAGAVIGAKKTLYLEEAMLPHAQMLDNISNGEDLQLEGYTPEKARADRIKVYTRVGVTSAKHYAVPGLLFIGGAGLVFGGHHIMLKRNAALAVAFTGLKAAFDKYRQNVIDQWGSEADQAMYSGYQLREIETEDGPKTIAVRDWDASKEDMYNRVFEQGASKNWQPDLGINKMFVHQMERYANELLHRRGYLYLSEVYQSLGFPESDFSRLCGWKVKRLPDGSRDIPLVSFGLDKPHPDDWKYDKDNAIYLDFNCQGLIIGGRVQKIIEEA